MFGASSVRYLYPLANMHRSSEVFYASTAFSYAARTVYHKVQQRLACPQTPPPGAALVSASAAAADPGCRLPPQTPPSGVQGLFFALAICDRVRELPSPSKYTYIHKHACSGSHRQPCS
jgi:hypothetical protein